MAKIDYNEIAKHYGTPNLTMDREGNIRDMDTGKVIAPVAPNANDKPAHLEHLRSYFCALPRAVQEGVLEHAKEEAIQEAIDHMQRYDDRKSRFGLSVSYEQLAAWASEGVLLEDDK